MWFAHFAHVWGKSGMTPQSRYEQLWRELELADQLGFDYAFAVEHHFTPKESWMSSPNLFAVAAGARTKRIRLGAMGHVVPLHDPIRLLEEIAVVDQMLGGRLEVGLVPGIQDSYFKHFKANFAERREITQEFALFLKHAYSKGSPISFSGKRISCDEMELSVEPKQRPYPPLWMESRDPPTLEFCAREGLNTGYFLLFPRDVARERYAPYIAGWKANGWPGKPKIAYSTVVYVDETDEKAMRVAAADAGNAYRGFFSTSDDVEEVRKKQQETAEYFRSRGEPAAADIILNLLDIDYLVEHDLVLIGSPDTVTRKLRDWAKQGTFNTFFGEFNFGELGEDDLMRSIQLFGSEVIPKLRDYEPF